MLLTIAECEAAAEFPKAGLSHVQDVFNFVLVKLFHQGTSSARGGACSFRGNAACRCAIGWLIPDADMKPEWLLDGPDGGSVGYFSFTPEGMAVRAYLERRGLNDFGFCVALQTAHDRSNFTPEHANPRIVGWRQVFLYRMRGAARLHDVDAAYIDVLEKRLADGP